MPHVDRISLAEGASVVELRVSVSSCQSPSIVTAAIVGASGYTGGELLRLLLGHPRVDVRQVTSERLDGQFVHFTHPNLRPPDDAQVRARRGARARGSCCSCACRTAAPWRASITFAALADRIVDLSADFRLRRRDDYDALVRRRRTRSPAWLERFVYGLPELHRAEIAGATLCQRRRLQRHGDDARRLAAGGRRDCSMPARGIVCEVKVGSSEGGAASSDASHHPERAGVMRSFAPTGHRHTAEVQQALGLRGVETDVHLSATAVDNVRGVLATAHVFVKPGVAERDVWKAYREAYGAEPFVRIVKERAGLYRYPEPKILAGSNYADVGFELDAVDRPRGRAVRDRQPDERRRRHGGAVRESDDGLGRDARPGVPGPASDLTVASDHETADVHRSAPARARGTRELWVSGAST